MRWASFESGFVSTNPEPRGSAPESLEASNVAADVPRNVRRFIMRKSPWSVGAIKRGVFGREFVRQTVQSKLVRGVGAREKCRREYTKTRATHAKKCVAPVGVEKRIRTENANQIAWSVADEHRLDVESWNLPSLLLSRGRRCPWQSWFPQAK